MGGSGWEGLVVCETVATSECNALVMTIIWCLGGLNVWRRVVGVDILRRCGNGLIVGRHISRRIVGSVGMTGHVLRAAVDLNSVMMWSKWLWL
jgi:hypothetical protein